MLTTTLFSPDSHEQIRQWIPVKYHKISKKSNILWELYNFLV